ncbi:hypothetical protein Tco_0078257 [Tanacetum coccineum]
MWVPLLPRGMWVPLLPRGSGCPITACHVAATNMSDLQGVSTRFRNCRSKVQKLQSEVVGFAGRLANKEVTRGNNDEVSEGSVQGCRKRVIQEGQRSYEVLKGRVLANDWQ